jgi:hypothetical protein
MDVRCRVCKNNTDLFLCTSYTKSMNFVCVPCIDAFKGEWIIDEQGWIDWVNPESTPPRMETDGADIGTPESASFSFTKSGGRSEQTTQPSTSSDKNESEGFPSDQRNTGTIPEPGTTECGT